MAKQCAITGKSSKLVGGYSNKTRATKFNPSGMTRKKANLMKRKVTLPNGTTKRVWVTASGLRSIKKTQANKK